MIVIIDMRAADLADGLVLNLVLAVMRLEIHPRQWTCLYACCIAP
jgi:hypothetical protein